MRKGDISFSSYSFIHNLECFFSQLYWFFCSQNLSDYQVLGSLLCILMSMKILKSPCIEKNQYFWSENFGGNFVVYLLAMGFPGGSVNKESACNAGDLGSIPELGRSSGEGNGNLIQYSFLENSMDRGAQWATVHGSQRVGHDWMIFTSSLLLLQVLAIL